MTLTPLDIHNKEFKCTIRGYSIDEVNNFLDKVIKDFDKTLLEKKELCQKIINLEEKLSHYTNLEETLNQSIVIAVKTGEESKKNAQKEADLIVKEAEEKAKQIVNEATFKEKEIFMEIEKLKKQEKLFKIRLKTLVHSHLDLLEPEEIQEVIVLT